jgi:hypothetical protein
MSMTPEQENFEELRRLLALKRHEQPPPGYFHDFSRQVISRIRAGEAAASDSLLQRFLSTAPWLRNLWEGFEAKPIVAGVFGIGVCSLLVVGLVSSERIDANPNSFAPVGDSARPAFATVPNQTVGSIFERTSSDHMVTGSVYTAQSRSIFDEIQRPHVQQVNFSVPTSSN